MEHWIFVLWNWPISCLKYPWGFGGVFFGIGGAWGWLVSSSVRMHAWEGEGVQHHSHGCFSVAEDISTGLWSRDRNPEMFLLGKCGWEWYIKWQSWALLLGSRKHGFKVHQPEKGMKPWCQPSWEQALSHCQMLPSSLLSFCVMWIGRYLTDCPFIRQGRKWSRRGSSFHFCKL